MKKILNLEFAQIFSMSAVITAFCLISLQTNIVSAQETYDLIHQVTADETFQIKSQVQYQGSIIVDGAGQQENQKALPLDVRGRFNYDQRISANSTRQPQAIRYYDLAEASIKAGNGRKDSKLEDSNKLLLARMKDLSDGSHHFQIASIQGTLRQKEYELLNNPGDPLAFADLFRKSGVKVGQTWNIEKSQIINLLSVNRIISDSVKMKLKSVNENIAKIFIVGNVKGEIDDVITSLKIKAVAQLDIEKKLVTAFRMSIDEDRRSGQLAPGFEGQVKVDVRLEPTSDNIMLNKKRLAEQFKGKKVKFSFLFDRAENNFQLTHSNKWRVIASEDEAAVLRYVEDGQMIAQCNIVQMARRPADSPLELSSFQAEVRKIISDAEARIVDSDRFSTDNGNEVLKVAVEGIESRIPFSWIYYHIAANDGRRVTLVFTLEKEAEEVLDNQDRILVKSVLFKELSVQKTAQRAKANAR